MRASNVVSRSLRDVVTLTKGKPPAQQPYFGSDAERYLTPDYLRGKAGAELVKASANAVRVDDGDTIVLWDGSNAGEVMRGRAGVLSSTMARASHGSNFDGHYLFYAIKQWETFLKGQTSGSGIPHVDKEIFRGLAVLEFELAEQTAIAEILSTVDRAIEQTETLIAKRRRIKTGLMQDLFTRGVDESGNLRSEQTHEFKDSPLGRISVEWDVQRLGDISRGGAQNGFFKKPELVGSGFKLINVSELYQPFGIDTKREEVERIEATPEDLVKFGVEPGDIFFTRSSIVLGGIAHANMIREVTEPTLFECHVMRVRANTTRVLPEFITLFCDTFVARTFLMSRAKHVTMATISQPELEDLPVPVPRRLAEQSAIVEAVLANEKADHQTEKRINKLRSIKTALMQDLLTGRRRTTALLPQREGASA